MSFVHQITKKNRFPLPNNYSAKSLKDKLYYSRSTLPTITHVDFSARIQTVHKETNPKYWQLLKAFKNHTNCSVLINTSFNVRGEPIVCYPYQAYECFMNTEMDYLVIGNNLYNKKLQDKKRFENKINKENLSFTLD